ncbi:ferredoxin--NADP reductase [Methylorubrum extorquens]|uniref:Oxidoreductase FAD/NAD(P)-binding domain protein n=1 Tax=Methylorubrum extorquens (strain CM4 / NCIMB 13688) TaxID=440085 RepID=B7L3M3_METC4|nr:ferredoxin--NADP reductase [Methylorubrum extorquens]ACK86431.1 oxidoreductase FAD/NAD(P)-binding domain protein [Methylorubrum extorquens CM4]
MNRTSLIVADRIAETEDTCSLRFQIPPELRDSFNYEPGQFVHVRAEIDGVAVERSYSLSSSPASDAFFQLTVKKIDQGVFSTYLVDAVKAGHSLELSRPQGRFFRPEEKPHHYLLIGVGSGVTPLFSILKWLLARSSEDQVTLLYGSRREEAIIFRNEIDALSARYGSRLRVVHVLSQAGQGWNGLRGRIDRALITGRLREFAPEGELPEVAYLCGPGPFMDAVTEGLVERGFDPSAIHRESFAVATDDSLDLESVPSVRIGPESAGDALDRPAPCERLVAVLEGAETDIEMEAGESILQAVLRAGLDVPFSCKEGTCLSCMCRVEAGAVQMKDMTEEGLTLDDLGAGIALACMARPDASHVRLSFDDV